MDTSQNQSLRQESQSVPIGAIRVTALGSSSFKVCFGIVGDWLGRRAEGRPGVRADSYRGVTGAAGVGTGPDAGAGAFPGILSLSPTLIRSVVRLLALRIALGVVPNCAAILVRLSPGLTTYSCPPLVAPAPGSFVACVAAIVVGAGITSFWPGRSLVGTT